ncbi:MAG: response regulator [Alphaproteobacteria bacterium]|nr:response regulator [Alphaproteobacteria bacterium]
MDALIETDLPLLARATARQPLLGLTILLVEDSRYCSEAVRLLCRKSGARLRRADCRWAAYRHLATYRPSLVIVDIGLPDGSGLDIVRDLAAHRPNAPKVLATSGDDPALCRADSLAAGADGFLEKPLKNIQSFQTQILALFPDRNLPDQRRIIPFKAEIEPDTLALSEDLRHAAELVEEASKAGDHETLIYCAQFLHSLAEANGNRRTKLLAGDLANVIAGGASNGKDVARLLAHLADLVAKGEQI